MYRMGWVLIATGFLAACAGGAYMPANANGHGYSERQLSNRGYEVTYVGEESLDQQRVDDYALLHAAELGASRGFGYLSVISTRGGEAQMGGGRTVEYPLANPHTSGTQTLDSITNVVDKVRACTLVVIYSKAPEEGLGEPSQAIPPLVAKLRAEYGLPAAQP